MRQHALFFIRHNNDIDHLTPVIYKWCQTVSEPTHIIVWNGFESSQQVSSLEEVKSDYRLQFLQQNGNIRIHHISSFWPKGHALQKNFDSAKLAAECMFDQLYPPNTEVVVVFDHSYSDLQKGIYSAAKQRNYICLGLPHGGYTHYKNHLLHIDAIGQNIERERKCHPVDVHEMFDAIVFPDSFYTGQGQPCEHYREQIIPLGSARFCKEWVSLLSKFAPKFSWPGSENGLKIVMFLRSKFYPIFWEEVARTIQILLRQPNVFLVVQHHPRENDFLENLVKEYPSLFIQSDRLSIVGNEIPSATLTRWSDVIVDLATTISFEGIIFDKPVLEMEYLHATHSTVAHYLPETHMHCRDDLIHHVEQAGRGLSNSFYDQERREWFIKNLLQNNSESVLSDYCHFLQSYKNQSLGRSATFTPSEPLSLLL